LRSLLDASSDSAFSDHNARLCDKAYICHRERHSIASHQTTRRAFIDSLLLLLLVMMMLIMVHLLFIISIRRRPNA